MQRILKFIITYGIYLKNASYSIEQLANCVKQSAVCMYTQREWFFIYAIFQFCTVIYFSIYQMQLMTMMIIQKNFSSW